MNKRNQRKARSRARSRKKALNLPRVPLPVQTEKVHEKKSKDRRVKHPKREESSWNS